MAASRRRRRTATARTSPARMTKGQLASSPKTRRVTLGVELSNSAVACREAGVRWADRDQIVAGNCVDSRAAHACTKRWQAMRTAADQTVGIGETDTASGDARTVRTVHRVLARIRRHVSRHTRQTKKIWLRSAGHHSVCDLRSICSAIDYWSAADLGAVGAQPLAPVELSSPGDPADPQRFLSKRDPVCADWTSATREVRSRHASLASHRSALFRRPMDSGTESHQRCSRRQS